MSHSTFIKDEQKREWVLIHNGDWSGDVLVRRIGDGRVLEEYELPGILFRQAARSTITGALIGLIETWDGSDESARAAQDAMARCIRHS
jgi:hypothetical protein